MTAKLLTFAVPTYNRAGYLRRLLDILAVEVRPVAQDVEILIFDNASDDETSDVTADFLSKCPNARVVRHARNIGSAPNFIACYEAAESDYFWLFGDDDVPAPGLLARVVGLLTSEAPDLIYADSRWAKDITPLLNERPAGGFDAHRLDRDTFCRRTNVHLTFISSIIVNKARLQNHLDVGQALRDMGDYFVQLTWTLGALNYGRTFSVIKGPCVFATQGNSGGYGPMTVFGVEFPKAVIAMLGRSSPATIILRRTVICYLPGLFWNARNGTGGKFVSESPWAALREWLGGFACYWLFLIPIGRFSRPLAWFAFSVARVGSYALRRRDRRLVA